MTITQLIERLQQIQQSHPDAVVVSFQEGYTIDSTIDRVNVQQNNRYWDGNSQQYENGTTVSFS